MIKRIEFVTRHDGTRSDEFAAGWRAALARWADAPAEVRPARVAACTVLHDVDGTDARHDGVEIVWCTDAGHLERCEEWLVSGAGELRRAELDAVVDPELSRVVVAEEFVGRGAEWLTRRWAAGGDTIKQMAVAHRADGLTPAEFSEIWRQRAGQVRQTGTAAAIAIPDRVRGLAYVQNHPLPTDDPAYDAINEVYFDDLAGLRTRIEWFAENVADGESDMVSQHWFLAARETLIALG